MKFHHLLIAALALAAGNASAQTVLFAPNPATGSNGPSGPPTTYTAGTPYTLTTSGSGTITYAPTSFTVGGASSSGNAAYIKSTETVANTNDVHSQFTFTPTYSDVDSTGAASGQTNISLFSLEPNTGANNNVLGITLQTLGYGVDTASIIVNSGISFGGGNTNNGGPNEYSSHGVNSLSGVTLTLSLYQVYATDGSGNTSVTTTGRLSSTTNPDLFDYDYIVMAPAANSTANGYDPANNTGNGGLIFQAGLITTDGDPSFINPGATVAFSGINVASVPEPSTYVIVAGGIVLLICFVRRRIAA